MEPATLRKSRDPSAQDPDDWLETQREEVTP